MIELVIGSILVFQTFIDKLQNKGTTRLKIPKWVTNNHVLKNDWQHNGQNIPKE